MKEQAHSFYRSIQYPLYILIFALGGGGVGLALGPYLGFSSTPVAKEAIFFPIITFALDGVFLAWFTRTKEKSFKLFTLTFSGLIIGSVIGSFIGGMMGTILSIPFGQKSFSSTFLAGTILGMLLSGASFPMILIRRFIIKSS